MILKKIKSIDIRLLIMGNTYTQLHVDFVFSVKFRAALIYSSFKDELYQYIMGIVKSYNHKL
jgi:putative transposase